MAPRRIADTAISVAESIRAQQYQSIQYLEQRADETIQWFAEAFETRIQQIEESRVKHAQEEEKQPAKKKPKVEDDTSETKEFVSSLLVRELVTMLQERGLDDKGVKKVLQERLLDALEKEKSAAPNSNSGHSDHPAATNDTKQPVEPMCESRPVEMEVEGYPDSDPIGDNADKSGANVPGEIQQLSSSPRTDHSQKAVDASEHLKSNEEHPPQNRPRSPLKFVRSAIKALSPKQKTVNSLIQRIESSGTNQQTREEQTVASTSTGDDVSQRRSDSKMPSGSTSATQMSRGLGAATASSTGALTGGSSTGGFKSLKAMHEARRAKIAEIRSKSKPVVTEASSISAVPALSKVRTILENTQAHSKDGRKNLLAAQMREKANAKLQVAPATSNVEQIKEKSPMKATREKPGPSSQQNGFGTSSRTLGTESTTSEFEHAKENSPNQGNEEKPGSSKRLATASKSPVKSFNGFAMSKTNGGSAKSLKGMGTSSKTMRESSKSNSGMKKEQTPSSVKSKFSNATSPMDTYELSDREPTDSESEDEGQGKQKSKRIPEWAQKARLVPALEHQFAHKLHDPDQIFGEVQTCDLQEIFDKKKERYQRRTSSGNWTQDRVTAAEKLAYKRNEGFSEE